MILNKYQLLKWFFIIYLIGVNAIFSEEIIGKVCDGLNRPIEKVQIKIYDYKNDTEIIFKKLYTNKNGIFKLIVTSEIKDLMINFDKEGYKGFSIGRWSLDDLKNIRLDKEIDSGVIKNLINQKDTLLYENLKEILSSKDIIFDDNDLIVELFKIDDHIETTLTTLLSNNDIRQQVIFVLFYLYGDKMIDKVMPEINKLSKDEENFIIGHICGALLEPTKKKEWSLLTNSIKEKNENWSAATQAALALGLIRNKESYNILKSVSLDKTKISDNHIQKSLNFKNKYPNGISFNSDIDISIKNISELIIEESEKNKFDVDKITYNRRKNKVLVSVSIYHGPLEARGYNMVFHKKNNLWIIKGIWFTWIS